MLDRLAYMINKSGILCDTCGENTSSYCAEQLALYLLDRGVILPPLKLGDDVWWIDHKNKIQKQEKAVKGMMYKYDGKWYVIDRDGNLDEVGTRFAYATREDAEEALKGGEE